MRPRIDTGKTVRYASVGADSCTWPSDASPDGPTSRISDHVLRMPVALARNPAACALYLMAVLLAGAALFATPASAVSRPEVFRALRVDQVPADYVILVDDSASMRQGDLDLLVRRALGTLLSALSPADHLALIDFANAPALRYTGPVGRDPRGIVGRLPARAQGHGTDLGAALANGLDELERPDASDVAALMLLTDGKHTPLAGTAYPTLTSQSWDRLGERGTALLRSRSIGAYAVGLRDSTDADLLKRAFANAAVVALPPTQLRGYFERIKEQTRIAKARQLVAADRAKGVRVGWPASVRRLDLTRGSGTVEVTLQNELAHVPVVLNDLSLAASGVPIRSSGLPRSVALGAGANRRIPIKLTFSKLGGFRVGKKTVTQSGQLTLRGDVSLPWAAVLTKDLRVDLRPHLNDSVTPVAASGKVGWGLLGLALLMLVAALVVWAATYKYIDRRPKLRGSLTVFGPGVPQRKSILHGRVMKIGKGQEIDLPAAGRVEGKRVKKRGRRRGTDVELVVRYGKGAPARIPDGHAKAIGDINFTYRGL